MSLKNVGKDPLYLLWNGRTTVLKPGQTCHYLAEPAVERRMKHKFGDALEYVAEPVKQDVGPSVVIDDAPAADSDTNAPAEAGTETAAPPEATPKRKTTVAEDIEPPEKPHTKGKKPRA